MAKERPSYVVFPGSALYHSLRARGPAIYMTTCGHPCGPWDTLLVSRPLNSRQCRVCHRSEAQNHLCPPTERIPS